MRSEGEGVHLLTLTLSRSSSALRPLYILAGCLEYKGEFGSVRKTIEMMTKFPEKADRMRVCLVISRA